ncbi:hypothetical protein MN608_07295 [Microdochium nivale]|nr:hypothetical protein MN608_07295 [Microdochium nivale]
MTSRNFWVTQIHGSRVATEESSCQLNLPSITSSLAPSGGQVSQKAGAGVVPAELNARPAATHSLLYQPVGKSHLLDDKPSGLYCRKQNPTGNEMPAAPHDHCSTQ